MEGWKTGLVPYINSQKSLHAISTISSHVIGDVSERDAVEGHGSRLLAAGVYYEDVLRTVFDKEAIDAVPIVPTEETVPVKAEAEPVSSISHSSGIISPLTPVCWRSPAPRPRQ
jgi:hypothetical protein